MYVPTSKNTLKSLSQNMKETLWKMRCPIPKLINQGQQSAQNEETHETFSSLINLSLGSYFILSEMISLLRSLIDTNNGYEKRFYMKWLNHCFCEAYVYFCKKNNENNEYGVWLQIKSKISTINNSNLDNNINLIDKSLENIKNSYCNIELRNATAHFNDPQDEYNKLLVLCKDDDHFAKGTSLFMGLHIMIVQFCNILIDSLIHISTKQNQTSSEDKTININNFSTLFNNQLSKAFNRNNELKLKLNKIIYTCTKNLDNDNKLINGTYNLKNFLLSKGIEFKHYDVIIQIILIKMTIAFMQCDLACTLKSYLHSEDNIERASNLRRINLIETSILTKLYGYNKQAQASSLWAKLHAFDKNFSDDETRKIDSKLKEITKELDSNNRNLNTHYRESEKLNIIKLYERYNNQNHAEILTHYLKLMKLCKNMNLYIMHVIDRYKTLDI